MGSVLASICLLDAFHSIALLFSQRFEIRPLCCCCCFWWCVRAHYQPSAWCTL